METETQLHCLQQGHIFVFPKKEAVNLIDDVVHADDGGDGRDGRVGLATRWGKKFDPAKTDSFWAHFSKYGKQQVKPFGSRESSRKINQ